ncbi:MAG TPA: hypothetical protein P5218_02370 [Planctomycetota bacterium]|nr:hypothetical protein [Planctomycetota bacterium]HRV80246.1 hypothetical protein [Planctomycetota bacterium]
MKLHTASWAEKRPMVTGVLKPIDVLVLVVVEFHGSVFWGLSGSQVLFFALRARFKLAFWIFSS